MASKFQCSQDTKSKVEAFEEADRLYKTEWEAFEREHEIRLNQLDRLRDDRNAKLDEAKRALRQEAEGLTDLRTTFSVGPFKVQKKWSDFYIPEKTVAMLTERGLYDSAVSSGIVAIRVELEKFDQVQKFLQDHQVSKDFESCEDGAPAGAAVSGPKSVPPFGAELKKE